jgi:hypothetical protein
VQAPSFSRSLNPYRYAFHSPLRYTDPSGFTVAPPPAPAPPVTPKRWANRPRDAEATARLGIARLALGPE